MAVVRIFYSRQCLSRLTIFNSLGVVYIFLMEFKDCVIANCLNHPKMETEDLLKLVYQASFGGEHMLSDYEKAHQAFLEEYTPLKEDKNMPLYEMISPLLCRVNMRSWKGYGWEEFDLFELFLRSALLYKNDGDSLKKNIDVVTLLIDHGEINGDFSSWGDKSKILLKDKKPVHHSETYSKAYDPHYRVVSFSLLEECLISLGCRPTEQ
jgi:hypothetical protein